MLSCDNSKAVSEIMKGQTKQSSVQFNNCLCTQLSTRSMSWH